MSELKLNHELPKRTSYKRIIVCSDGTWLSSNTGLDATPSNVAKLARSIANRGMDTQGDLVDQIVFYHSGLGTGDLPLQKAIYGGLGLGLDLDVCQVYDFIANNYERGDEIFMFGFSRGAFTVRSVASLVCEVGVLSSERMSHFPKLWKMYMGHTSGEPFTKTEWYLSNHENLGLYPVKVKVVGVWDTVGALGFPEWPVVSKLTMFGLPINKQFAFHNTKVSKFLDYAFQALAIDEKRLTFPPTLWHKSKDGPSIDLQQCWFPGIHGNIGGQAEEDRSKGDHEEIGYNTLAWMVDNLSGMLTFKDGAIKSLVKEHQRALDGNGVSNGWGCGPILDNFAGLEGLFFRLLGRMDRTPGSYPRDPGDGSSGSTNEYFHPILRVRRMKLPRYNPRALQGYSSEEPSDIGGWKWAKNGVESIPEFVMDPQKTMNVAYDDEDVVRYRTEESMSRRLCPRDILRDLDRDNQIMD